MLPPWLVFHAPHAGATIPAALRDRFLLSDAELLAAADRAADRVALELFLDPTGLSPNVRGTLSRLVVNVESADATFDAARLSPDELSDGTPLRRPLRPDEIVDLQERHAAHHDRLTWAVRKALDLFGSCVLVTITTIVDDDVCGPAPDVWLGSDPLHTPKELLESFATAFTTAGLEVGSGKVHRAIVPTAAYARDPAVRALSITVHRRVVDHDASITCRDPRAVRIRAACAAALERLFVVHGGMIKPPPLREPWRINEALDGFLVDATTGVLTPLLTPLLPSLPPTQAHTALLALPSATRAALGIELGHLPLEPQRPRAFLRGGIDAANAAARDLGVRVRFLPAEPALGAATTAIESDKLTAYRETIYRCSGAIRTELRPGHNHLPLRDFYALYGVESAAFVTACNPLGAACSDQENARRQAALRAELERRRLTYFAGEGAHPTNGWPPEPSFLVMGLDYEAAVALGRSLDQDAIVWAGIHCRVRLVLLR